MVSAGVDQWTPQSIQAQRKALERAQRDGGVWLVNDEHGALGGALALPQPDPPLQELWRERPAQERCLYVQKMVLAPGRWGRGLGRSMLAALEERARSSGFDHVRLDCVAGNDTLVRFYQRDGYYPVGIRTAFGTRVLRLEKNLCAARELSRMLEEWQPDLTGTLLFVVEGQRVLLIHKKTGHGAGKINAPGGKLEDGETPEACAVRETYEEVGIRVRNPRLMARLKFADSVAEQWLGYVYLASDYTGAIAESPEANPHWYALNAIPYHRMWQDDRIWLPLVLAGHEVEGEFLFRDGSLRAHRLA
jgi:8-oxo-dGTP diphosphatase